MTICRANLVLSYEKGIAKKNLHSSKMSGFMKTPKQLQIRQW